ncbi:MAG: SDR family NAD(P)-dependent oxidoreductase [Patescibacteria group bacterium]
MFGNNKTMPKFCDLRGKVAIITGARRGMGRTHALTLARAGAKVVVSDVSQEECEAVVQEIKNEKGEALAVKCDISNKIEVDNLIQQTLAKFGKVDILVNNAGICPFNPFLEMKEEDFKKVIDVNLKGYFLCSQAAAKEMAKQKSGAIVNIASIAMGQVGSGFAGLTHYCASKGGIVAMAEAMSLELAPLGIRVNTIAPGAIDTPMVASVKQDMKNLESMLAGIPLKRMGKPEEISNAVLFLASDESSYMTGSVVVVDGGWTAN